MNTPPPTSPSSGNEADELAGLFREMADEELVYRCSAGTLTEFALSIAIEELTSRGFQLPAPLPAAEEAPAYEGDFETVARFLNPTDAHVVCACLVAAGLPAIVADANLAQTNSLWAVAIGGARVLVPSSRVAEAKEVIAAFNRGDFALSDDSNFTPE